MQQASKLNTYNVVQPEDQRASKVNAYGVVEQTDQRASKVNAYNVVEQTDQRASKLATYLVLIPEYRQRASKVVTYLVLIPEYRQRASKLATYLVLTPGIVPARYMPRAAVGPPGNKWWPPELPGANLDYTDFLYAVQAQGDIVASASLAIEPSGMGERTALGLSVDGYVLTVWFTGGVPGRVYRNQITITGVSGRVWQWVISQRVSARAALPPLYPLPPAPTPGFGPPITWSS